MDVRHESLERAERDAASIAALLTAWYEKNKRPLPWRSTSDPYAIWLSEIMLQQTQAEAVIPYYRRFLERFPTIEDLARAPLEAVLKMWEKMGYYSRARHLHQTARLLVSLHGGRFPENPDDLKALPGIGLYTAGAILSIAFGKPVPAVDGNVKRVLSRLFSVDSPLNLGSTRRILHALAEKLVPIGEPGRFNQALMELGALLCRPKTPQCPDCPLRSICLAYRGNCQQRLPVSGKKTKRPHREAVAAVILGPEKRILLIQRPASGFLGGLWTFPGGMICPGETLTEALEKRCREELNISISVGKPLMTLQQAYSHFHLTLHVFQGTIPSGVTGFPAQDRRRWATSAEVRGLPFSGAELRILEALRF